MALIEVNTDDVNNLIRRHQQSAGTIVSATTNIASTAITGLAVAGFNLKSAVALEGTLAEIAATYPGLCVQIEEAAGILFAYVRAVEAGEDVSNLASNVKQWLAPFTDRVHTVKPLPNGKVTSIQTYELKAGVKGEVAEGNTDDTITVEKVQEGGISEYKVTIDISGTAAAELGGGAVSADGGLSADATASWYVSSPQQADALKDKLMAVGAAGGLGGIVGGSLVGTATAGLATWALQIPQPQESSQMVGATAGVSATDGPVTVDGSMTVGVEHVDDEGQQSGGLTGTISASGSAEFGIAGLKASGSVNANVSASLLGSGAGASLHVEGAIEAQGSIAVDGHSFTAADGGSVRVEFSTDVDLSKASADVVQAVEDLKSDPSAAEQAIKTLVSHGVTVDYSVFAGTSNDFQAGDSASVGANVEVSETNMTLVKSGSFSI